MDKYHSIARSRTYSITDLWRELGTTARALRFYEEQGLISPGRHEGRRVYSYKDRARVVLIVRGRKVGLSIAEIRDILFAYDKQGVAAQNARAHRAFSSRIRALELQRQQVDETLEVLRAACQRLSPESEPQTAVRAVG
jgi:DNA-binding transcriptional MerR regulator